MQRAIVMRLSLPLGWSADFSGGKYWTDVTVTVRNLWGRHVLEATLPHTLVRDAILENNPEAVARELRRMLGR